MSCSSSDVGNILEAGTVAEEGPGFDSILEDIMTTRSESTEAAGAVVAWEDLSGFRIDLVGKVTYTAVLGRAGCTLKSLE